MRHRLGLGGCGDHDRPQLPGRHGGHPGLPGGGNPGGPRGPARAAAVRRGGPRGVRPGRARALLRRGPAVPASRGKRLGRSRGASWSTRCSCSGTSGSASATPSARRASASPSPARTCTPAPPSRRPAWSRAAPRSSGPCTIRSRRTLGDRARHPRLLRPDAGGARGAAQALGPRGGCSRSRTSRKAWAGCATCTRCSGWATRSTGAAGSTASAAEGWLAEPDYVVARRAHDFLSPRAQRGPLRNAGGKPTS